MAERGCFSARDLSPCSRQDELHVFPALCKAPRKGGRAAMLPFLGAVFPLPRVLGWPHAQGSLAMPPCQGVQGNTGILSKGVVGAGVAPTCLKPFGALKPPPILQKLGGHKSSSVPRTACLCFPASSPSPPRARYGHIPQKIYWGSLRALLERTVLVAKPHSQ